MVIDKDEDVGPKKTWETGIHSWPEAKKILICKILFPKTSENRHPLLARGQENSNLQDFGPKKPQTKGFHSWPEARKILICKMLVPKTSENGLPLLARGQENLNLQRRNDQAYIAW